MKLVKVYPQTRFQSIIGFGAALTEAAGYVYAHMDDDTKEHFIRLCFGSSFNAYSLCRLAIQSCDFSLGPRSYCESAPDADLSNFSIEHDHAYVLPLVKDALAVNPDISFLASPWSPPSWAKTNRTMKYGGHLRSSKADDWASMIARFVSEYAREGVRIDRITVQNEVNARQTWESCLFNAKQEIDFLSNHLKPALEREGHGDVKILVWDHNKEGMLDRATAFLADERASQYMDGVAFHWYSGDHFEALAATRQAIGDDQELIFTEGCDFFTNGDEWWQLPHAEHYAHEIIGDVNAGANGFIDWNIVLDSNGGPNHVQNFCDAPIMYNIDAKRLMIRKPFLYLGHFSRFVKPGARRLLCTSYTSDLETCAFANPDGSKVAIVLNRFGGTYPFYLNIDGGFVNEHTRFSLEAPAHSIQTICW